MFSKMPLLLIAMIIGLVLCEPYMPLVLKEFLFTISLSLKAIIIGLLPFVIFTLLFKVAAQLTHHATKIIILILAAVCCSNFITTMMSHQVGSLLYGFDLNVVLPQSTHELSALWSFSLPKLIPNDKAMYAGLALGIVFSYFKPQHAAKFSSQLEKILNQILKFFTYIIPLFLAGFVVKLNHDGIMKTIIQDYSIIFVMIALAQFCYIALIYFLSNNMKLNKFVLSFKNMTPAAIAGFSTMSSAAAMPLTMIGTAKNVQNPDLAKSVIPATVNIHLMGDCFAIPILAFAILKSFGFVEPHFYEYLIFACFFVLAKFSVAAVPGGGIIVMLPILENYLGFTPEMLSLITALYILFDPVITCANVLGNGGLAMVIDRIQGFVIKTKEAIQNS